MSGFTTIALAALLAAVFFAVVAILLWQEAKRRRDTDEAVYVISDALKHIEEHLDRDVRRRVGDAGIQRIIEWELFYLQGLAQPDRRQPVEAVAGGSPAAVDYIAQQIAKRHGIEIPSDDIRTVLALEAAYLRRIGAVGEQVGTVADLAEEERG